jgi:hypothetical protein
MASTSPGTSPWPTSAPELGLATGDEGNPKASPHEHKDALDLLPVDHASHANTTAVVDFLPQLPPLSSAADTVIEGPSQHEFDAEHTGDPPHASHSQYDIV